MQDARCKSVGLKPQVREWHVRGHRGKTVEVGVEFGAGAGLEDAVRVVEGVITKEKDAVNE